MVLLNLSAKQLPYIAASKFQFIGATNSGLYNKQKVADPNLLRYLFIALRVALLFAGAKKVTKNALMLLLPEYSEQWQTA